METMNITKALKIVGIILDLERLIKKHSSTRCGDKQATLACEISTNISLLREQGFNKVKMENPNGVRKVLNLETGSFE